MPPAVARPFAERRVLLSVFAVLLVLLGLGYYLFLRPEYAVLYTSVRPSDAAAIVAQLDTLGVPHRLRDNGQTILVPVDQADNARVQLAGSESVTHGGVGFELFNHSDMGLTDFAQKINYQRALQGELARTIMTMDGIESARVHLAIPEHTLFRSTRSDPKAAIEVVARVGTALTPDRVAGIQRLVAAAVPDLTLNDVVVLDSVGRVISQAPAAAPAGNGEQAALQNYYAERARTALQAAMPGLTSGVHVVMIAGAGGAPGTDGGIDVDGPAATRAVDLRVTVTTEAALGDDDQRIARGAVSSALHLGARSGDAVLFQVGPVEQTLAAAPAPVPVLPRVVQAEPTGEQASTTGLPSWSWLLLGSLAALLVIAWLLSRRSNVPSIGMQEQAALAERLRRYLPPMMIDA